MGYATAWETAKAKSTGLEPPQAFITENSEGVFAGTVTGSVWLWKDKRVRRCVPDI